MWMKNTIVGAMTAIALLISVPVDAQQVPVSAAVRAQMLALAGDPVALAALAAQLASANPAAGGGGGGAPPPPPPGGGGGVWCGG